MAEIAGIVIALDLISKVIVHGLKERLERIHMPSMIQNALLKYYADNLCQSLRYQNSSMRGFIYR